MTRPFLLAIGSLIGLSTWSLAAQPPGTVAADIVRSTVTRATLVKANSQTTIQGNALTSTNGPLNNVMVRLRDARFGRIVDTQVTDSTGLFTFKGIDPGSYIVEIMANDQTTLAASELLTVNAGDAVSAVVKLPFRVPPFAAALGGTNTTAAALVTAAAVASGLAAVVPTAPVSPIE